MKRQAVALTCICPIRWQGHLGNGLFYLIGMVPPRESMKGKTL